MSDAIKASIDTSALPDLASPTAAALAYLGDAVLELLVRERLVVRGLCASASLNSAALAYVKASAQSEAVERLIPHLTEREEAIYKRGRNAGHGKNTPKSASVAEYRRTNGTSTESSGTGITIEARQTKTL